MTYMNLRCLSVLSISLLLNALTIASFSAQAAPANPKNSAPVKVSLKFKVPDRGTPTATAGGATRGTCALSNKAITPLVPQNKVSLTLAERPSFFLYVPRSPAKSVELLMLTDDDTEIVYQKTFAISQAPGVMRFDLPQDAPELQVGKQYHWYLTVNCDPNKGPSGNPSVEGWIERTQAEQSLTKALATAEPGRRPELYAQAGLWYETLTSVADLRRSNPTNPQVVSDWQQLLQSVGLEAVSSEPIVNCCTLQK